MDEGSQYACEKSLESVAHVAEVNFENPVYEREGIEEPKQRFRQPLVLDYSMLPKSIKFIDNTKRKRRLLCYIFLILLFISTIAMVILALVLTSDSDAEIAVNNSTEKWTYVSYMKSTFTIENLIFDIALLDFRSKEYRTLSDNIVIEFSNMLENSRLLKDYKEASNITFRPGSVMVRLTLTFSSSLREDQLAPKLETAFRDHLVTSVEEGLWRTYLGEYIINDDWSFYYTSPTDNENLDTEHCTKTPEARCVKHSPNTILPNALGHTNIYEAALVFRDVAPLVDIGCYDYTEHFLCTLVYPPCRKGENSVNDHSRMFNGLPPCRSMCEDFSRKCRSNMPQVLAFLNCEEFDDADCVSAPVISIPSIRVDEFQSPWIQVRGSWLKVCGTGWSSLDGVVFCRQINNSVVLRTWASDHNITDSESIILNCIGSESHLGECEMLTFRQCPVTAHLQCTPADYIQTTTLSPAHQSTTAEPTTIALTERIIRVRLQDGSTDHNGRVEVFYKGTWGSVCNTMFTDRTASVLCRQMGYSSGTYEYTRFGAGSGPMWLTDVLCEGWESAIHECLYRLGDADCSITEAASIACQ